VTDANKADAPPAARKWLQCNGRQLQKLAQAALLWLERNHEHVNSLNVFPVPDGDTGTNMLLTMRSAYNRIKEKEDEHVGKIAESFAHGALMGARGNSGVILSQILRGLARGFKDKAAFNAEELARALKNAADTAYGGVMKPVEGTILTVIREGALEAADAAQKSSDLRFVLDRVLERCQQALERTPDQLPILKQAGVVDSGGQGLIYILEGMMRYTNGELRDIVTAVTEGTGAAVAAAVTAQELARPENGEIENPYDVQFILLGENLNVLEVREKIDSMGDSTVVVGDETTIKVHVHVEDPGVPISYGITLGQITDVVIENMQMQMEDVIQGSGHNALAAPPIPTPELTVQPGQIGVVAVSAGDGLSTIFRSLGAAHIVNGGQTNNPSIEEIFQAIQDVPTDKVIILPNNKNIILAAEGARDLSPKRVAVVPTRTTPQGLSALLALNPDGDLEETTAAMTALSAEVATGEITRATRSVTIDGVSVNEGELIGLVDGRLCAAGMEMDNVLPQMLEAMEMEEREIVSLYYGSDVDQADAEALAGRIEDAYEDVEVEIHNGGQAHYFFILGAE